jgi:hypothetical protein
MGNHQHKIAGLEYVRDTVSITNDTITTLKKKDVCYETLWKPPIERIYIIDCPLLTSIEIGESIRTVDISNCPNILLTDFKDVTCIKDKTYVISVPVKTVVIEDCTGLTELPNWSFIEEVSILDCPNITTLPKWTIVKDVKCARCPGITKLPDWPYVNNVIVYQMNIKVLPRWMYVKTVNCSECDELVKLPKWPVVEIVRCLSCPKLEQLSLWPVLQYIDCSGCPKLKELHNWPVVKTVALFSCTNITQLYEWPNVKIVSYDFCPNIRKIYYWPKYDERSIQRINERSKYKHSEKFNIGNHNFDILSYHDRLKKIIIINHFLTQWVIRSQK